MQGLLEHHLELLRRCTGCAGRLAHKPEGAFRVPSQDVVRVILIPAWVDAHGCTGKGGERSDSVALPGKGAADEPINPKFPARDLSCELFGLLNPVGRKHIVIAGTE